MLKGGDRSSYSKKLKGGQVLRGVSTWVLPKRGTHIGPQEKPMQGGHLAGQKQTEGGRPLKYGGKLLFVRSRTKKLSKESSRRLKH